MKYVLALILALVVLGVSEAQAHGPQGFGFGRRVVARRAVVVQQPVVVQQFGFADHCGVQAFVPAHGFGFQPFLFQRQRFIGGRLFSPVVINRGFSFSFGF